MKTRLEKTFDKCRSFGITFDGRQEQGFYTRLNAIWLKECEEQEAKEEQERIKEIMREEQRAEKMRASELKKIDDQEKVIQAKQKENAEKLKQFREIESLKSLTKTQRLEFEALLKEKDQLAQDLSDKERAKSMAELTKAGHIYVISNVGSFGENIYKVGMTRRLIPEDRVDELGDASVPFPFDIHMMISTEGAQSLEKKLHECLSAQKVNCVNNRKEFFRTDINTIKSFVDKHSPGIRYHFLEIPEASQWRESKIIWMQNSDPVKKSAA